MKKRFFLAYILSGASLISSITTSLSGATNNNSTEFNDIKFDKYIEHTQAKQEKYIYEMNQYNKAFPNGYKVVYSAPSGAETERNGGTRAWRNNNPGCIRGGDFARAQGAIGNAGGFAVFPDEQTGMKAICALLRSEKYADRTIADAINIYAPTFENNTAAYKSHLLFLTGLPLDTKLRDLDDEQLNALSLAIKQIEGWVPGIETQIKQDTLARITPQKVR